MLAYAFTAISPNAVFASYDPETDYNGEGNLFKNGDCSIITEGWNLTFDTKNGAAGSKKFDNKEGNILYSVEKFPSSRSDLRFSQSDIKLIPGKKYKLSFLIKSSKAIEYSTGKELLIEICDSNNKAVYITKDSKNVYFQYRAAFVLQENEWTKIEWDIDTSTYASGMNTETYLMKFNIGGAQKLTGEDGAAEIRFDNFMLKEDDGLGSEVSLSLTLDEALKDDVIVLGEGNYRSNSKVTIKAAVLPGKNYVFVEWVDATTNAYISSEPTYSFTIDSYKTYKAVFKPLPQYKVEVSTNNPSFGSVTPTTGSYKYGDIVTLTATPNGSNVFVCWEINGKEVSKNSTYQLNVKGNHYVKAYFIEEGKNKVTFKDEGGSVLNTAHTIQNEKIRDIKR